MKHHLFTAKNPKNIFKELGAVEENDIKDDVEEGRMFDRVSKIPIASTFDELVEMCFADYGDFATFLRIQATFSRFSAIILRGANKKEEQTAEMVREKAIPN